MWIAYFHLSPKRLGGHGRIKSSRSLSIDRISSPFAGNTCLRFGFPSYVVGRQSCVSGSPCPPYEDPSADFGRFCTEWRWTRHGRHLFCVCVFFVLLGSWNQLPKTRKHRRTAPSSERLKWYVPAAFIAFALIVCTFRSVPVGQGFFGGSLQRRYCSGYKQDACNLCSGWFLRW